MPFIAKQIHCAVSKEHLNNKDTSKKDIKSLFIGKDFSVGNKDQKVLYIDSNNNRVGINTVKPRCALDIIGSLKVTGSIKEAEIIMLSPVGTNPDVNGCTINNTIFKLQPANNSYSGILNTIEQIIAGSKTFNNGVKLPNIIPGILQTNSTKDIITNNLNLSSQVENTLSLQRGGTSSNISLNNDRYMVSSNNTIIEGNPTNNITYVSDGVTVMGLTDEPFNINFTVEKVSSNTCILSFKHTKFTVTNSGAGYVSGVLPTEFCPIRTMYNYMCINNKGNTLGKVSISPVGEIILFGGLNSDDWQVGVSNLFATSVYYRTD